MPSTTSPGTSPTGHALYPFFYRDPHGHISYPPNGEGWYWGPGIIAATKHHPTGIRIHDWIEFTPARDDKPFAFVQAEADRHSDTDETATPPKSRSNSASTLSTEKPPNRKEPTTPPTALMLPRYFQPEWAGYVTACCRAEVYDTAMHDPDAVIMIATDGIYATRPSLSPKETASANGRSTNPPG